MAGNPYTGSGARFQVPDMLANRADVWNLGDVRTGKEAGFADSFLENALTSSPVLAQLAGRDRADLELFVRLAEGDPTARADRLAHPYGASELEQILAVVRHLLRVRETVLAVNAAYIASAAQSGATRTEPPFRLQGSYRTMNRIAQRIRPVMNGTEVSAVIDDHFAAEAQTLTGGAEASLLKLAELRGTLTPAQATRWAELKAAYVRKQALGGPEQDGPPQPSPGGTPISLRSSARSPPSASSPNAARSVVPSRPPGPTSAATSAPASTTRPPASPTSGPASTTRTPADSCPPTRSSTSPTRSRSTATPTPATAPSPPPTPTACARWASARWAVARRAPRSGSPRTTRVTGPSTWSSRRRPPVPTARRVHLHAHRRRFRAKTYVTVGKYGIYNGIAPLGENRRKQQAKDLFNFFVFDTDQAAQCKDDVSWGNCGPMALDLPWGKVFKVLKFGKYGKYADDVAELGKAVDCKCFLAGTNVLMADGSTKNIESCFSKRRPATQPSPEARDPGCRRSILRVASYIRTHSGGPRCAQSIDCRRI